MRYDHLLEAVSEDAPCGADLDEIGDDAYLNYVLPAADRLPDRFYVRETGAPFDRSSIDLKGEVKAISELLERTRDLRLLALEARFQALAGQIVGFCECLQTMAALIDARWEEVHPRVHDGDYTLRQNTLSALDDRATIILPLEYAPLASDKRIGSICLRHYRVARGDAEPRDEEAAQADLAAVLEAVRADDNRERAAAVHAAVLSAEAALLAMRAKFQDAAGYEYAPSYDGLQEVLGQLRGLLEAALPDLAAAAPAEQGEAAAPEEPAEATGETQPAEGAAAAMAMAEIASHAAATAALLAVEGYFARCEPSSPSLILVHQARTLVGKPLVVALDTLLPQMAERALISVDTRAGLQLSMPAMRSITETVTNGAASGGDQDAAQPFEAGTRAEAEGIIHGVEAFFRRTEPSSPIPLLLARARTFMNRDFSAILADIIKVDGQELPS